MDESREKNAASTFPIIPIERTVNIGENRSYLDRYFVCKYYLNLGGENNDHCVLIHSNRLCVLALAQSHPLIRDKIKINKIDFQVSKNVNRLDNKASGKRKRNAQCVNLKSPICFVECCNNEKFTISSPIPGKLLEINERLQTVPELLNYNYKENYNKECYIAVIIPKHNISMDELTKDLIDETQYRAVFRN